MEGMPWLLQRGQEILENIKLISSSLGMKVLEKKKVIIKFAVKEAAEKFVRNIITSDRKGEGIIKRIN